MKTFYHVFPVFFFFFASHSSGNRNPQYLLLNQIPPASSSPPILLHILFLPIKFTRKDNTPRFRERLKRILQSPFFAILVRIKKLTGLSSLFRYWGLVFWLFDFSFFFCEFQILVSYFVRILGRVCRIPGVKKYCRFHCFFLSFFVWKFDAFLVDGCSGSWHAR